MATSLKSRCTFRAKFCRYAIVRECALIFSLLCVGVAAGVERFSITWVYPDCPIIVTNGAVEILLTQPVAVPTNISFRILAMQLGVAFRLGNCLVICIKGRMSISSNACSGSSCAQQVGVGIQKKIAAIMAGIVRQALDSLQIELQRLVVPCLPSIMRIK